MILSLTLRNLSSILEGGEGVVLKHGMSERERERDDKRGKMQGL